MKKIKYIYAAIAGLFLVSFSSCNNEVEYFDSQITSTSVDETDAVPRLRTNSEKYGFQIATANGPALEGATEITASQWEKSIGQLTRDFRFIFPDYIRSGERISVELYYDGQVSFDGDTFSDIYPSLSTHYLTAPAIPDTIYGAVEFRIRITTTKIFPYYTYFRIDTGEGKNRKSYPFYISVE